MAAHADADEWKGRLDKGKHLVRELHVKLTPIIETWEAEVLDVARAVDAFAFIRSEGIGRLGAVLGELRAKLGGNAKAAYSYTQQGRSSTGAAIEDDVGDEVPSEEG